MQLPEHLRGIQRLEPGGAAAPLVGAEAAVGVLTRQDERHGLAEARRGHPFAPRATSRRPRRRGARSIASAVQSLTGQRCTPSEKHQPPRIGSRHPLASGGRSSLDLRRAQEGGAAPHAPARAPVAARPPARGGQRPCPRRWSARPRSAGPRPILPAPGLEAVEARAEVGIGRVVRPQGQAVQEPVDRRESLPRARPLLEPDALQAASDGAPPPRGRAGALPAAQGAGERPQHAAPGGRRRRWGRCRRDGRRSRSSRRARRTAPRAEPQ